MKNPPYVKPGEGFTKTWRVQNAGSCTWTPNYLLKYAYGNVQAARMNGTSIKIPGNVLPGQTVDLSVALIAPMEPLTYQGFWQMENGLGQQFGQAIWVAITTFSDQTNPAATPLPQPTGNYCVVTTVAPIKAITVHGSFDAVWTVKNISGSDWSMDSVDYRYISGTEMHETPVYDLPQTVKDGDTIKIIVDMIAPATPNVYNASWAIVAGNRTLCVMNVSVNVIAK